MPSPPPALDGLHLRIQQQRLQLNHLHRPLHDPVFIDTSCFLCYCSGQCCSPGLYCILQTVSQLNKTKTFTLVPYISIPSYTKISSALQGLFPTPIIPQGFGLAGSYVLPSGALRGNLSCDARILKKHNNLNSCPGISVRIKLSPPPSLFVFQAW